MKITSIPVTQLKPYDRNTRRIEPEAIDKVAASIQEFGWRQPIVVDPQYVVIVGHVRLLAAKKLGLREVPVHVAENLSPQQVRAYRLMDNRSHEETSWDTDLLEQELLGRRRPKRWYQDRLSQTGQLADAIFAFIADRLHDIVCGW